MRLYHLKAPAKPGPRNMYWVDFYMPGTIERPRKRKANKRLFLFLIWGATGRLLQTLHEDTFSYILHSAQFSLGFSWIVVVPITQLQEASYLWAKVSLPQPPPNPSPAHMEGHWAQTTSSASNLCKMEELVSLSLSPRFLGQISSLNTVFITGAWSTNLQMSFPLACC